MKLVANMETQTEALATADFEKLRSLILDECGISLGREKKTMLEIRLKRRLRSLNLSSYTQYCGYLFAHETRKQELVHLIDVVTTNKTDFFREPDHFGYLVEKALPVLNRENGTARRCEIWSAGCSTGEEPYTLAMLLSEYAQSCPGFRFHILATDVSTTVLDKARLAVFRSNGIAPIPPEMRRKYLMRGREPGSDLVRVVPELRAHIEFRRLNFMDRDYGLSGLREIIFCRNVIIYFDRATQIRILRKLLAHLSPGGYFFSGHSESLQNMDLPLVAVGAAVYRKCG